MQDILTAITYLQSRSHSKEVNVAGLEMGGIWSVFARALAGPHVNLAADLMQFGADDQQYLDKFFVPGLRKAGDFRAAAVLDTQDRLFLHNVGSAFPAEWVRQEEKVRVLRDARASEDQLLQWLAPAGSPQSR